MADPINDSGFVYDDEGFIDIINSSFFGFNPNVDGSVEEYVERIIFTLTEAIEEQLSNVQWIVKEDSPLKGLVRAVGVSNYGPKQLLKIHDYLKSRGVPLCSAQIQFSLLSFGDDQMELKAVCDSLGIQLISYSPLGLGMLTGKYSASKLPRGPRALLFRQILPRLDRLLDSLREIAQSRDKTMSQVAINWCICKGTIPIPGVKSVRQAEENLGSLGWRLSSDEISELESAARDCPRKMIQNIFQTQ